jgi:hypothetical protein
MQYSDDRYRLRVEIQAKGCSIPQDELARMQQSLQPLGEAVEDFPNSELTINVICHPRSQAHHIEARLKVPGKTLFSSDEDAYLDSAFQRCLHQLIQRVGTHRENPNSAAAEQARQRQRLDDRVVAPAASAAGPLGRAVEAGDYRAFRLALSSYEEWLRKRVGRWIQRYPEAEARLHNGLLIGDVLEEVYLNAFECFRAWPRDVALREWLDGLIDPSLKLLLRRPDEGRENASLARTLSETPL